MKLYRKLLTSLLVILFIVILKTNVNAASVNISAPANTEVGKSVTITLTGTGAATYDVTAKISGAGINDTIRLVAYSDDLKNETKSASKTITPTTTGTITVSINAGSNCTVSGGSSSQSITGGTKTINVNPKSTPTPTPTPTPNPSNNTPEPNNQNNKKTQTPTTKTTTNTKKENKQTEVKQEEATTTEEPQQVDEFYIKELKLIGIKENGEKEDIELLPEFNSNTMEYECTVSKEFKKFEIEKDAGIYTNSILVSGLEDENENTDEQIITLMLSAENHEAKTYTIKIKKIEVEKEELAENNIETTKGITIPTVVFIIMIITIIAETITLIVILIRKIHKK